GSALQQAALDQERLVHLFERRPILSHGSSQRVEPHRSPHELLDDGSQYGPVTSVEAPSVDPQCIEGCPGAPERDNGIARHLRVVAHPAQKALGYPHGAPGAVAYLEGSLSVELEAKQRCVATHAESQLVARVVLEVFDDPE